MTKKDIFQVSSDIFWSSETFYDFLVLEGDDVIQTVAGVSGIMKRFFRGETGVGFCFFFWGGGMGLKLGRYERCFFEKNILVFEIVRCVFC